MVKELLGCVDVWCDSRSEESSQSFVLWAGSLLLNRRGSVWAVVIGSHLPLWLEHMCQSFEGVASSGLR